MLSGCVSSGKNAKKNKKSKDNKEKTVEEKTEIETAYTKEKNITVVKDGVKYSLNGSNGTFLISAVDSKGLYRPVLSTLDSGSSSYFAVKVGKKEYKLDLKSGNTPECRKTSDSSQFVYKVDKDRIEVTVEFKPYSSYKDGKVDMIEVSVITVNNSDKYTDVACKAIFDTFLGEGVGRHFTTKDYGIINSEKQFSDFKKEKWVISENGSTSVQFILSGNGVTSPQYVTFANREFLTNSNWVPSSTDKRSFNSILSLNNSAFCVNWSPVNIAPGKSSEIRFYIALSTNGREPRGRYFLASAGDREEYVEELDSNEDLSSLTDLSRETSTTTVDNFLSITFQSSDLTVSDVDDGVYSVDDVTEEQMDTGYIEDLLDRINTFIAEDKEDDAEFKKLNSELDAILKKLEMK